MIRYSIALIAALSLSACVPGESYENEDFSSSTTSISSNSCQLLCKNCPPNQLCLQVCELVGVCTSSCTRLALCVEGYHWDNAICACLPDAGQPCGDRRCGAGEYCCNESCGICAPTGGFCIQIACETAPTTDTCKDPVACFADPCAVSTCDVQGATCASNYCGVCNAVWTDANGNTVCN